MTHKLKTKIEWFSNTRYKPEKEERNGNPIEVFVSVICNNGARFTGMDCYDKYSGSWIDNQEQYGKRVVAWAYPPSPSIFELFLENDKSLPPADTTEKR